MARYVIGISGASGAILGYRLCQALLERNHNVELVLSRGALFTAKEEMGESFSTPQKFISNFPQQLRHNLSLHAIHSIEARICSGTYPVDGMAIVPCSMATVAAIACGLGDNSLRRAADVALKEKRRLIVVPRETPLSEIHLENLLKLARMGAVIVPPIPAWYMHPTSLSACEAFVVGKVLDLWKIEHDLYTPWTGVMEWGASAQEKNSADVH